MGKPKDTASYPLARGYKYVKKAGAWLYYETFNTPNVADKMEWFSNQKEAEARYNK